MRTLPQAPNLDYLKQQAKDLLAALREEDPSAILSKAQRALAQQYGLRTWIELRAEVERVRSKSKSFDRHTAALVSKAFDLGDLIEAPVLVQSDVMGPWVRVITGSGSWYAHAVLDWVDDAQAEEAVRLMDAARAAGIRAPSALRTKAGALVEEAGEHRWRVDEWIDLGPTIVNPVSKAVAFKAGELLATLHGLDLEPKSGVNPWLAAKPRSAEDWERILDVVREKKVSWAPVFEEALPAILDISVAHVDPPTEGLLWTHTDFQPPTTHLGQDGSLTPMGWEFAGAITPAWHLGMVLDSWCAKPDEGTNHAVAKPLLDGYKSVAGSVPDLDVSIFSPVITAWLNWLVSRMNYALQDEDAEKRQTAEREVRNMLAFPHDCQRFQRLLHAASAP